jgi:hypothetical protein
LDEGLVRVGAQIEAAWGWVPLEGTPEIVLLEGTIMRLPEVNIAFTMAHELGHKGQRYRRDVQYALDAGNGAYELIRDAMETDAESYAQHVVINRITATYCEH